MAQALENTNIILLGGHGKIALIAARLLTEAGAHVTSVIRNPDHQDDVRQTGADPLVLDMESADTAQLAEAFQGKDAVVFSAGAGGGNPTRTYAVDRDAAQRTIDAAQQAGVDRYVMVSYAGSSLNHGVPEDNSFFPYAESKAAADEYLRNSSLNYTILGPGLLTLEEPSGTITRLPEGASADEDGFRDTARANVAQAIVSALRHPESAGRKTVNFIDGKTPIDEVFATV